jgi:hypothetical protein
MNYFYVLELADDMSSPLFTFPVLRPILAAAMLRPICFPKLDEELLDKFVLPGLWNADVNQLHAHDLFRSCHSFRKLSITRETKIVTGCGKLIEPAIIDPLKLQGPY